MVIKSMPVSPEPKINNKNKEFRAVAEIES
jgi:hypothetical protein